ncbi:MAG TPA: plastocyanin/azurin family copper-binding protein [Candidatus Nitrosotalea sp.]|nr:plastocyanin/azurin family copper-binding protein [Candidatus Nitrosotalea sp.]
MMSKPTGALFGVLTLVAILAIAPSAFAQESTTVNISAGAGSGPNCSQSNNCFDPNVITVAPGTTVEWKNNDKVSHTVTSGSPSDNQTGTVFDSSLIASGKDFSFTFNNPGTFNYFCQVHPWMTGQVIVSASAASSSSGSSMNMPSGSSMSMPSGSSMSMNTTTTPSGQGQQGGIPLGSPYNAPANVTTSAPTPAPPSQAPQYGSQVPSSTQAGQGQQSGVPLGSPYNAPANVTTSAPTPAPPSQAPQYGQQAPAVSTGGSVGQQNGIPLGTPTSQPAPANPDQMTGWAAGIGVAAAMSGIGIWSAVRRR